MIWEGELPKGYWINRCKLSVPYINGAVESHEICVLTPIQTIFLFISCPSVFNGEVFLKTEYPVKATDLPLITGKLRLYNERETNSQF